MSQTGGDLDQENEGRVRYKKDRIFQTLCILAIINIVYQCRTNVCLA